MGATRVDEVQEREKRDARRRWPGVALLVLLLAKPQRERQRLADDAGRELA